MSFQDAINLEGMTDSELAAFIEEESAELRRAHLAWGLEDGGERVPVSIRTNLAPYVARVVVAKLLMMSRPARLAGYISVALELESAIDGMVSNLEHLRW